MDNKLLEVKNLQVSIKTYRGEVQAVRDVSFSIEKGEVFCIVGESGCGKSVTSMSILQLLGSNARISGGSIKLDGKELIGLPEKEMCRIRGNDIAMIFQDSGAALCPIRTVGDQIYESMREHERISRKECAERAVRMMAKIGLKDGERVLQSYPFELSGGMKRRVSLVRAMEAGAQCVLLDEPFTGLDEENREKAYEYIRTHANGRIIMIATHIRPWENMPEDVQKGEGLWERIRETQE